MNGRSSFIAPLERFLSFSFFPLVRRFWRHTTSIFFFSVGKNRERERERSKDSVLGTGLWYKKKRKKNFALEAKILRRTMRSTMHPEMRISRGDEARFFLFSIAAFSKSFETAASVTWLVFECASTFADKNVAARTENRVSLTIIAKVTYRFDWHRFYL